MARYFLSRISEANVSSESPRSAIRLRFLSSSQRICILVVCYIVYGMSIGAYLALAKSLQDFKPMEKYLGLLICKAARKPACQDHSVFIPILLFPLALFCNGFFHGFCDYLINVFYYLLIKPFQYIIGRRRHGKELIRFDI